MVYLFLAAKIIRKIQQATFILDPFPFLLRIIYFCGSNPPSENLPGTDPPKPLTAMKEQKHSICYMILPERIREDLAEGLKALSEKHAKEKRMATEEERSVAAAQILKSKTNAAVSFELVEGTHFSPILPWLEKAFAKC